MKSIAILKVLVLGWMIFFLAPSFVFAKQDKTQIIILHTNNLNGKVIPCPT
jgi:hypothetical protein